MEERIDRPLSNSRGTLLGNLLVFARLLRQFDLDITTGRILDAARSVAYVDISKREDFYNALKANFVSRYEDIPRFDRAFTLFWGAPKREDSPENAEGEEMQSEGDVPGETEGERKSLELLEFAEEEPPDDTEKEEIPSYSPAESLTTKDFSTFTDEQVKALRLLIARLAPKVSTVVSRRTKPDNRADQIDPRRTLRRNIKYGGDVVEFARKRRKIRKTKIVLICDVSGSMDLYSKILIQFLYALQNEMRNIETLVFTTRITRITNILKSRDLKSALDEISNKVKDWSGGTSIGSCLRAFNTGFGRSYLNSRTVVVIISDGWDRGDTELLGQEMRHLARNSFKIIWLNPLLGSDSYQPLAKGMAAAVPYIDYFLPAHNLNSLIALARTLRDLSAV